MAFNFSGLGNVYPGYLDAMKAEGQSRVSQQIADIGDLDMPARDALGRAVQLFTASMPGAQPMPGTPMGGPQPPPPGQASVPAAPPGGMGGGGGMPGQAGVPQPPNVSAPPAPGPAGGMQQIGLQPGAPPQTIQGRSNLDLPTAIELLKQANPGIRPAVLQRALELAAPALNQEAKQQLAMMGLQHKQEVLDVRRQYGADKIDATNRRTAMLESIADKNNERRTLADRERTAVGREKLDLQRQIKEVDAEIRRLDIERKRTRDEWQEDQGQQRLDLNVERARDTREYRAIRVDQIWQRMKQDYDKAVAVAQRFGTAESRREAEALARAMRDRAQRIIGAHTAGGLGVGADAASPERKALLQLIEQDYNEQVGRVKALQEGRPGGVPGAGSTPLAPEAPPAVAPAAPAAVAPEANTLNDRFNAATPPAANATPVQTIPEGTTATNPQTGERLIRRAGQWVPAP